MVSSENSVGVAKLNGDKNFAEYVENHTYELYVDYRDELGNEQIDQILAGKETEVRMELENSYELSDEDMKYYWEAMAEDLKCTIEEIEEWLDSDEGFYPYQEISEYDWKKLLEKTPVCITATVEEAEWNFWNWAYGGAVNYSDVKDSLKVLGINPFDFKKAKTGGSQTMGEGKLRGHFPDMPNRVPKVNVDDLFGNMIVLYDGVLNFCLGNLYDVSQVASGESKDIVFSKGTNVVMYDFGNGAGITDVPLTEDLKIARKKVTFNNDNSNRYGIQACYGFVHSYWEEGSVRNDS